MASQGRCERLMTGSHKRKGKKKTLTRQIIITQDAASAIPQCRKSRAFKNRRLNRELEAMVLRREVQAPLDFLASFIDMCRPTTDNFFQGDPAMRRSLFALPESRTFRPARAFGECEAPASEVIYKSPICRGYSTASS